VKATDSEDNFGVEQAIVMAANHITFAATSDDASVNVQQAAPVFASHITRVPNGRWVFHKLGRGGNIDGYK
jgi:hypothetical protein